VGHLACPSAPERSRAAVLGSKRMSEERSTERVSEATGAFEGAAVLEAELDGRPRRWTLVPDVEVTVGSATDNVIVLPHPTVSRRHASLTLHAGRVEVKDLGSRNGTHFLGARVGQAQVLLGGAVRVGKVTLRFLAPSSGIPESSQTELAGMVGHGQPMRQLFGTIEKLAPSGVSVLIIGESGTGKDLVARALHSLSPRAREPFQVFDCGGVSPTLIEAELFGHVRGAFSGAVADRLGALEAAGAGTLFIDEIGELPLDLQPKLLRAIESREFRRVGEVETRICRARVVAATHRDLETRVTEGTFRLDLYHRLAVAVLEVPPLRDRPEDIAPLVRRFASELTGVDLTLSPQMLAAFQCERWPGNVRELKNAVQRTLALGRWRDDLPPDREPIGLSASKEQVIDRFEREYLQALLAQAGDNLSELARRAQISRSQLYRLLEKHGLGGKR
jgi:DNA-binding NtrC family response regulator